MTLEELRYELLNNDIKDIKVICYKDGKDLILPAEVAGYFKPDTAGRLRTIINTSGEVTEASAAGIGTTLTTISTTETSNRRLQQLNHGPRFGAFGSSFADAVATNAELVLAIKDILLDGSGNASNEVLTTAVASYYDAIEIIGIICDQTDAATTFAFQDEDDTACDGNPVDHILSLVAATLNTQLQGMVFRAAAGVDNKDLEVDISGGPANGNVTIIYVNWKET